MTIRIHLIFSYLFAFILFLGLAGCNEGINNNPLSTTAESGDPNPSTPQDEDKTTDDSDQSSGESTPDNPESEPETPDNKNSLMSISLAAGQYGGAGYRDGKQYDARLSSSNDVIIDSKGCAYISDTNNNVIRKYCEGILTTLAGNGETGFDKAPVLPHEARFNDPQALALDKNEENLYVADRHNHSIRKITLESGIVTTFAGQNIAGYAHGIGQAARFNRPRGVAICNDTLFIADTEQHNIRKGDLTTGEITLLAGKNKTPGSADGDSLTEAQFDNPQFLTCMNDETLFVSDTNNRIIRKIYYDSDLDKWLVTTIAGQAKKNGNIDAKNGNDVLFNVPRGIHYANDKLYIADSNNHNIRSIDVEEGSSYKSATLAGGDAGFADGSQGKFNSPRGIGFFNNSLFVADFFNGLVRQVDLSNEKVEVSTPFSSPEYRGWLDGEGSAALLNRPIDIIKYNNDYYITDSVNYVLRKGVLTENQTLKLTTYAGTPGVNNHIDGIGPNAAFHSVYGLALHDHYLYITTFKYQAYVNSQQSGKGSIRRVDLETGEVTTLVDPDSGALNRPFGMAYYNQALYVSDLFRHVIYKVTLSDGQVSLFAGQVETPGYTNGTDPRFNAPKDLEVINDALYVADSGNHMIRKIDLVTNETTTLAGSIFRGYTDDMGTNAQFDTPVGLTSDSTTLYIVDQRNMRVRTLDLATQTVGTLVGDGQMGTLDGTGFTAGLNTSEGIYFDSTLHSLFLCDWGENAIRIIK